MGERIRENFEDFLNGLENVSKQEFFDDLKNIFSLFPGFFLNFLFFFKFFKILFCFLFHEKFDFCQIFFF